MRKIILSIVLCNTLLTFAQTTRGIIGETNWLKNWTNFKSKTTDYNQTSNLLIGVISQNTTLSKKDVYLLMGTVYVTNGAILTIEPGTLIRGDYDTCGTLVITKGSKIIAQGEETDPIVFTSNKPNSERRAGDWGGIILFGESITNKFTGRLDLNLDSKFNAYGGSNEESNSGIMKYVRIEFAGKKVKNSKPLNGLCLAGVGNRTTLDYIQVSFSNNDSFDCYGGTVNLNHLVSFRAMDNDYDFTEGVQCKMNNCIAIRNPYVSSSGKPRCFKIQSYDIASNADLTKKKTNVIAKYITLLNEESSNEGLTREAIFVGENSYLNISNSVISGFNQSIILDAKIKARPENLEKIKLQSILINNCNVFVESEVADYNAELKEWYEKNMFSIEYSKTKNANFFVESDIRKIPDYRINNQEVITILAKN